MMAAKKFRTKAEKLERRGLLDTVKKDEMLAILIRNRRAFDSVRDILTTQHFSFSEGRALIWRVVKEYAEKYGKLPGRAAIEADLNAEINNNPDVVDPEEHAMLDEFLAYAFDKEQGKIGASASRRASAVDTCRMLVEEEISRIVRDDLLEHGTIPKDFSKGLEEQQKLLEKARGLTDVKLGVPFPDGWDTRDHVRLFTTGVAVLDTFLCGGWQAGEILLFMGTFGSCKTTLTIQGVSSLIVHCSEIWANRLARWEERREKYHLRKARGIPGLKPPKKPKKPVVLLAFTEGDKNTYRMRLLANLARVPWRRLNTMKSVETLSMRKRPGLTEDTEYEKQEFRNAKESGTRFIPERQRVLEAVRLANDHLVFIDCTEGNAEAKQLGKAGVLGISNAVHAHFRQNRDCEPIAMYLDHLSALARRMFGGDDDASKDKHRAFLQGAPLEFRDRIGTPLKIPIAIMHQLSGDANSRSSTARFHYSDSADCKSVAEYVDHAIVTGPADSQQRCVFDFCKHRRDPPSETKIVRVVGEFQRLVDISADHHVDQNRRRIVSREEVETLQDAAHMQHLTDINTAI